MEEYLKVLALAALPAVGNFLGGLAAEAMNVSTRTLSFALHAAAGVVLAVVGIELMPQALAAKPSWVIILAFAGGGGFFMLTDYLIEKIQSKSKESGAGEGEKGIPGVPAANKGGGEWAIFFGVAVDLFSDGVMIGTGSTVGLSLGLLLALGQVPGDIPEGFATIANFKAKGVARAKRLLLSASFAIPIFLGATVSYWLMRGQPEIYKMSLLAFTSGILLSVAVEEIMPEAHQEEDARLATAFLIGGFALFALISVLFD